MASGPITSWEIDGETVSDFIFGGPKITADGDRRHDIKRHLLLGRKGANKDTEAGRQSREIYKRDIVRGGFSKESMDTTSY